MTDSDEPGSPRDPALQRLWLIAYDLKNSFSIMSYAFHGLSRHLAAGTAAREAFADVQKHLTHTGDVATALIDALHEQPRGRTAISLHEFLTECEPRLGVMLGPRLSLEIRLSAAGGGIVLASTDELEQLLVALVSNAGLSMPDGGVVVIETNWLEHAASVGQVAVWPRQYVRLTVGDNGQGLDRAGHLRLLDPMRGDVTDVDAERDSIVSAVRRLHGWLIVDSDYRTGTRVHVCLPAVPEPPVA